MCFSIVYSLFMFLLTRGGMGEYCAVLIGNLIITGINKLFMPKRKFMISQKFLDNLFKDLYTHIGWSNFYNRFVLVEPIWYIKSDRDILVDCVCIDDIIYDFKKPFGEVAAEIIDEEASGFIEQALIMEKNYIFLCDNSIFFPYNRVEKFINYLRDNKDLVQEVNGLIHYHINEKELNESDIETLRHFSNEIRNLSNNEQLGMVISQTNPTKNFQLLEQDKFISNLSDELKKGEIFFTGKLFAEDGISDIDLIPIAML